MNPYCTEIDLDLHPLRDNLIPLMLPEIPHQLLDVNTYLNPEIANLLKPLGVYIGIVEAFSQWRYPWKSFIHIDDAGSNDIGKINWVFGGADSSVKWYQIKSKATPNVATTMANTPTRRFDPQDVEQVLHTHYAGSRPFVFQSGIPHQGCAGLDKRCCISMIPRWSKTRQRLTYQECLALFN